MILRPVRPASPIGPPITKRPVGFTWKTVSSSSQLARAATGRMISSRTALRELVVGDVRRVLGREHDRADPLRASRRRTRSSPGTWRRAAGSRARRSRSRRGARSISRWARRIGAGISSGVSSHAKPNIMPWSPAPCSLCRPSPSVTPWAMSGDCRPRATMHRAGRGVEAHRRVGVADVCTTWRTSGAISTCARVVISPATTTRPVVTRVSQATREVGSCASIASRTASEIWSHILSGWPIETDSEVKRDRAAIGWLPCAGG